MGMVKARSSSAPRFVSFFPLNRLFFVVFNFFLARSFLLLKQYIAFLRICQFFNRDFCQWIQWISHFFWIQSLFIHQAPFFGSNISMFSQEELREHQMAQRSQRAVRHNEFVADKVPQLPRLCLTGWSKRWLGVDLGHEHQRQYEHPKKHGP